MDGVNDQDESGEDSVYLFGEYADLKHLREMENEVKLTDKIRCIATRISGNLCKEVFPLHFVLGKKLSVRECTQIEFKSAALESHNEMRDHCRRYVNAFVNTRGGMLILGVNDNLTVAGIREWNSRKSDLVATDIGVIMGRFRPRLPPSFVKVDIIPVYDQFGDVVVSYGPWKSSSFKQDQVVVIVVSVLFHRSLESAFIMSDLGRMAWERYGSSTSMIRDHFLPNFQYKVSKDEEFAQREADNELYAQVRNSFRKRDEAEQKANRVFPIDESLPVFESREKVCKMIANSQVCMITGSTGCGKSTQVPQYVLHDCWEHDVVPYVFVAQPRRLAAVSLAYYVAEQMGVNVGLEVGFHIGGMPRFCDRTQLLFGTTGILKEFVVSMSAVRHFTHIVVDEVHERDSSTDVVLTLLKILLARGEISAKVILMSATVNVERLASFFAPVCELPGKPIRSMCRVLDTSGEEKFPVRILYLDNVMPETEFNKVKDSFHLDNDPRWSYVKNYAVSLISMQIKRILKVERKILMAKRDRLRLTREEAKIARGSILVFLPGIAALWEIQDALYATDVASNVMFCVCHSIFDVTEQRRALGPPEAGMVKVVLATNIAESSITIPDVSFVFDFCTVRELYWDSRAEAEKLLEVWASKDNCCQRKGRTGRVREGFVYRMIPKSFYETLPEHGIPEVQRCRLEEVMLSIVQIPWISVRKVLESCPDPPDLKLYVQSIANLVSCGLLVEADGDGVRTGHFGLTQLGVLLALLPVPSSAGLLAMLGYAFGMVEEGMILASISSRKNPIKIPMSQPLRGHETLVRFSGGVRSDSIAGLNAFLYWREKRDAVIEAALKEDPDCDIAKVETDWLGEKEWLSLYHLRDVEDLRYQIRTVMSVFGLCSEPTRSESAKREMAHRMRFRDYVEELPSARLDFETDDDDCESCDDGDDELISVSVGGEELLEERVQEFEKVEAHYCLPDDDDLLPYIVSVGRKEKPAPIKFDCCAFSIEKDPEKILLLLSLLSASFSRNVFVVKNCGNVRSRDTFLRNIRMVSPNAEPETCIRCKNFDANFVGDFVKSVCTEVMKVDLTEQPRVDRDALIFSLRKYRPGEAVPRATMLQPVMTVDESVVRFFKVRVASQKPPSKDYATIPASRIEILPSSSGEFVFCPFGAAQALIRVQRESLGAPIECLYCPREEGIVGVATNEFVTKNSVFLRDVSLFPGEMQGETLKHTLVVVLSVFCRDCRLIRQMRDDIYLLQARFTGAEYHEYAKVPKKDQQRIQQLRSFVSERFSEAFQSFRKSATTALSISPSTLQFAEQNPLEKAAGRNPTFGLSPTEAVATLSDLLRLNRIEGPAQDILSVHGRTRHVMMANAATGQFLP